MSGAKLLAARIRLGAQVYICALVVLLLFLIFISFDEIARVIEHIWVFAPSGIVAAIIANSTGTGGGVVFVPAFSALSGASQMGAIPMEIALTPMNTIAISFLIQCFGMSVGASVWTMRFYGGGSSLLGERIDGHSFLRAVFLVMLGTLPALLFTQFVFLGNVDGEMLLTAFKWLSLLLGIVLLVFTWTLRHAHANQLTLEDKDTYWLLGLGVLGGVITAYFSVGVGELVVVYLLLRKFPTVSAIAVAVVVTALTVLGGVWYHVLEQNIVWPVALVAIPGAMVGGFVARMFAIALGPLWLKTFASVWIIASSLFLIVAPYVGLLPK